MSATIHPKPQLAYLRDDGSGGLALCIKTAAGGLEVYPLKKRDAATWLSQLSEFVGRKLRDEVPEWEASHG